MIITLTCRDLCGWLIDHGILRTLTNGQVLLIQGCLIYFQMRHIFFIVEDKNVQENDRRLMKTNQAELQIMSFVPGGSLYSKGKYLSSTPTIHQLFFSKNFFLNFSSNIGYRSKLLSSEQHGSLLLPFNLKTMPSLLWIVKIQL